jgi:hypothetical protein
MMATGATRTEVAYHERARITQLRSVVTRLDEPEPSDGPRLAHWAYPRSATGERRSSPYGSGGADHAACLAWRVELHRAPSRRLATQESNLSCGTPKRGGWNGEP